MAKRTLDFGTDPQSSYRTASYLVEHGMADPVQHPSFIRNNYLRGLYEQLHTSVLYDWVHGNLGQMDEPVITKEYLWNTWTDMNTHGFFTAGYITNYYVDREMAFWHDMFPDRPRDAQGNLVEVIEIE